MYQYSMTTDNGEKYPLTIKNPVSIGDQIVYKNALYVVAIVRHFAAGGPSIIECRKID